VEREKERWRKGRRKRRDAETKYEMKKRKGNKRVDLRLVLLAHRRRMIKQMTSGTRANAINQTIARPTTNKKRQWTRERSEG